MKKFLISTCMTLALLASTSVGAFASTRGCDHSWKVIKANTSAGSVSEHNFKHMNSNGATIWENCRIITYDSQYTKECKVCGAIRTSSDKTSYHQNPDCPKHH